MVASHVIPDPSTIRAGKVTYVSLPCDVELHRIHPSEFGPVQFNDTDKGNARFSPLHDTDGAIIPTIYAAESFECAACEIILRCPDTPPAGGTVPAVPEIVHPADYQAHSHSVVRTDMDLKLVDVTAIGQRRFGVDHNLLLAGPRSTYPVTQAWARTLHASCPDAHGLYYTSYQHGPHFAAVLFGDRVPEGALVPVSQREVADAECHDAIKVLAASLSIEYEDV